MTYPDGEVVHYDYNLGGMLEKVYGQYRRNNFEPYGPSIPHDSIIPLNPNALNGQASLNGFPGSHDPVPMYTTYTYPYIDSIAYNEFELKSEVFYDNGTHTQYDYDSIQRLRMLQSRTSAGIDMQDISYTYDAVSNITGIVNAANYPGMNLGGTYSHSYEYDDLYRLTYSTGTWEDRPYHLGLVDTVRMAYHKNGRIARKNVFALTMSPTQMGVTNYNRRYDYSGQRNTLSNVYDSVANTSQNFSWDNSGNMVAHNGRSLTWTEDNRLQTVTDNEWFSYYQYDAGGDRTYKLPYNRTISNRSGRISYYWAAGDATLYASPYLVVTPRGYTKHYYAESERITSQIGRGKFSTLVTPVTDTATVNNKVRRADSLVLALNPGITDTAAQLSYLTALTNRQKDTCEAYWYHSDHLGSSSWTTDSAGNPVQHLHYLPWGEDYVNQRLNDFDGVRYTFSAKEKDSETGLSYFGSRYYSSDLSIWLSVDPMSDKYPSLSPYVYCADNPVKLVDPNGEENVYAFHYAQRHLLNKVGSVHDISTQSWYGYGPGQHRHLTQQDPDNESCYGIIWHAYMNSGDKITSYLQTGFSDKNNSFIGRYSAKEWFKEGNDSPANKDGLSRSFETDIMKGEIGDIVFMNGHAAMLAGIPEQIEEDGNTYVKMKVFTSTSDSGFIEQDIVFDANNKNRTRGWSGFEGYGQLHQTKGKGDPNLE